jgi:small subunit ribosomal protein S15
VNWGNGFPDQNVLSPIFWRFRASFAGICWGVPAGWAVENQVFIMPIAQDHKAKVIAEFGSKPGDTGSPEVQIAVLTADIQAITEHLQTHPKDYAGRRGLLAKVSRRRQLLDYLRSYSVEKYLVIIGKLGIRK